MLPGRRSAYTQRKYEAELLEVSCCGPSFIQARMPRLMSKMKDIFTYTKQKTLIGCAPKAKISARVKNAKCMKKYHLDLMHTTASGSVFLGSATFIGITLTITGNNDRNLFDAVIGCKVCIQQVHASTNLSYPRLAHWSNNASAPTIYTGAELGTPI